MTTKREHDLPDADQMWERGIRYYRLPVFDDGGGVEIIVYRIVRWSFDGQIECRWERVK